MSWISAHVIYKSKIIVWIYLLISLIILGLIIYKHTMNLQSNLNFTFLYFISISAIAFCLILLKLEDKLRLSLILFLTVTIFSLYTIETFISFNSSYFYNERYRVASKLNVNFDKRSQLQVINDLRDKGIDSVPYFPAMRTINNNNVIDSNNFTLAGVSNILTVGANENGNYGIYTSDRYGFNNPDNEWQKIIEVASVGDSFIHGATVLSGNDITSKIRTQSIPSINLGMGGHGPLLELATLLEYAKPYKINKILWFYYEGNDFIDLEIEKNIPLLMDYLEPSFTQNLPLKVSELDSYLKSEIQKESKLNERTYTQLKQIILLGNIRALYSRFIDSKKYLKTHSNSFDDNYNNNIGLFIRVIEKAKTEVEAWGGEFYFIYLPEYLRYLENTNNHNAFKNKKILIDQLKPLNVSIIDIHSEVFSKTVDPLSHFPFRLSGHYDDNTYNAIANIVSKKIQI